MEVCGTHTAALFRTGIRAALPGTIRCLSGPGCPVCVTPPETVETAIGLARRKGTVLFSFGDMLRVPGRDGSLETARASGAARVRMMLGPVEALEHAVRAPREEVVMFGVGFETTIPAFAAVLRRAAAAGVGNLFLLPAFRLIPPAIEALFSGGKAPADGFLLPGHVSAVIGARPYAFLPGRYGVPGVIAGFEPVDLLEAILALLGMIERREPAIVNRYARFVPAEGNPRARALMDEVFAPCDSRWRGMGDLPASGLRLRDAFARFDAARLVDFEVPPAGEPAGCICGEVLRGSRTPAECPLFRRRCTPAAPVGPCMVSAEGTCSAFYQYGDCAIGGCG